MDKQARNAGKRGIGILCTAMVVLSLFSGQIGGVQKVSAADDLQTKLQSFENEAWQARLFQLDDKISIGKSVANIPNTTIKVGDDIYLGGFSSLTHVPGDPANVFYTSTDRGPNGDIDATKCSGCKVFPIPDFTPRILKIQLENGSVKVLQQIPLKLPNNAIDPVTNTSMISGVSNFPDAVKTNWVGNGVPDEVPVGAIQYNADGSINTYTTLPSDPYALDLEGIAYNPVDQTFWMGEEYRPSLVQVKLDGTIMQRLVPNGEASLFANATAVPIHDVLPAVFSTRNPNRGFESSAITPDGKYMFTAIQSPMINPMGTKPNAKSRAVRLLKLDMTQATPTVVGEYLYVLDGVNGVSNYISDLMAKDDHTVLFDERDANYDYKKIYQADLTGATNILGQLDNVGAKPTSAAPEVPASTLENSVLDTVYSTYTVTPVGGTSVTVTPVQKSLLLDTKTRGYPNSKLEGIFMPNDHTLVVVNDNDFSVQDPDQEQVWMYTLSTPAATASTVASKTGTVTANVTNGQGGSTNVTVTTTLGEDAMLGTAIIQLPSGLIASETDTVTFGNGTTRNLRASEIKDGGNYVVLDGVVLHAGESIQLNLLNKTVTSGSIAPYVYVDSDGPEAAKSLSAGFTVSQGNLTNPPSVVTSPTGSSNKIKADASGQVDAKALIDALAKGNAVVQLTGTTAQLPALVLTNAVNNGDAIQIVSTIGSYTLPLSVLKLDDLAKALNVDVKDLTIKVTMQSLSGAQAGLVNSAAASIGSSVVGSPIDFQVQVVSKDGKSENVPFGNTYVSRSVTLDQVSDWNHLSGAWFDPETQTLHFVPTTFETKDGKTGVTFKRNGNSQYVVVKTNKTFNDISNHWAKTDIELLANKLIVDGVSPDHFDADRNITRAEFAALVSRSLGLSDAAGTANFTDVPSAAWYAKAVATVAGAGIIKGYADNTFKPNANITREEMAAMIVRALTYVGKPVSVNTSNAAILAPFNDASGISWAKSEVAAAVQAGIIKGITVNTLVPQGMATRAESAATLKRFLIAANFINS
jgi:N-acetylmuramoyl-L-alanine amidase